MMTTPVRSPALPAPAETGQPAQSSPDPAASLFALLFGGLLHGAASGPAALPAGRSEGAAPPLCGDLGGSRMGRMEPALAHDASLGEPARAQADTGTPQAPEIASLPPFGFPVAAPGQGSPARAELRAPGWDVPPRGAIVSLQPGALAGPRSAPDALEAGDVALSQRQSATGRTAPDPGSPLAPGSFPLAAKAVLDGAASAPPPAVPGAPLPRHAPTGRAPSAAPATQSTAQGADAAPTAATQGAGAGLPAGTTSVPAPGWRLARDLEAPLPAGAGSDHRDGPSVLSAEILEVDVKSVERGAVPVSAPVRAVMAPPPALQVAMQIARAASSRIERMVVELEPAELGRIEIHLKFGEKGRVQAAIAAERAETLDWLQRDAAALERSLREAGLRPDAGGLSFSLRREQPGQQSGDHGSGQRTPPRALAGAMDVGTAPAREVARLTLRLLDIRA